MQVKDMKTQHRAQYFNPTGNSVIICPTTWGTDYCAVFKIGFGVEWKLQCLERPELGNGRC
jgi:hypothetical protein